MSPSHIRRIVEASYVVQAVSPEHQSLQEALSTYAKTNGFTVELLQLSQDSRPDVLRYNPVSTVVFVGDAKNSANETPRTQATVARISKYVVELSRLLTSGVFLGACIAIATDDLEEAQRWINCLTTLATLNGLYDENGDIVEFKVLELDQSTFIVSN